MIFCNLVLEIEHLLPKKLVNKMIEDPIHEVMNFSISLSLD